MKIVLTGAGGGHFYPLIAVAERLRKEAFIQNIKQPELYFFSDKPYDDEALFELGCSFVETPAGKLRLYPSFDNFLDIIKTVKGCFTAIVKLYSIYPDVVFAKGGYASFPTLFAARILSIPVVVHESDTVPGRTTKWAGKFAVRVALSYEEAAAEYPRDTVALTGQPIRDKILPPSTFRREYAKKERPVVMVFGGSQGSQIINTSILGILPELLNTYDIVHQTGTGNIEEIKNVTNILLKDHPYRDRYFAEGFIDVGVFYPKVDLVITRAGSSMFEMVVWQLPMVVIPIPESISRDQRSNAYSMASHGFAIVLEENNLGPNILISAISRILDSAETYEDMIKNSKYVDNSKTAATVIAQEIIRIGLSHSQS
jgi:UDP-N-acetylglucosamine--N-acetylmuramyl-(pentapeptide) pyrophosphoryl-undecaprenol N-acetylglucosamine transferase